MAISLGDLLKSSGVGGAAGGIGLNNKSSTPTSFGVSQDKYAFPDVAAPVAGATGANVQTAQTGLLDLLKDPANNSGVNAAYQSYLAAQRPAEEQGYQDLADQFKAAGAEQSGNYGTALSKYAAGIQNAHAIGYGNTLQSILSPMVSGYSGLAGQAPNLLDSLKMRDSFQAAGMDANQGGIGANKPGPGQMHGPLGTGLNYSNANVY